MSERSQVIDKIMKWAAREPKTYAVKVHSDSFQGAGIPDILMCYHGLFVAVEAKNPAGGRLSKLQKHQLELINKAGGLGIVCCGVDELIQKIKEMERCLKEFPKKDIEK